MAFYIIGIQEDGLATGDVCGPCDSRAEAEEMAASGQVPWFRCLGAVVGEGGQRSQGGKPRT
ncbi:MAG TPA: hypothetical protein VHJ18_14140 [Streptosporangiaceae bacterium]|jgi:hypothetical protein|nr:hypothetical protein [Streptosporangiaceae bacterium]